MLLYNLNVQLFTRSVLQNNAAQGAGLNLSNSETEVAAVAF